MTEIFYIDSNIFILPAIYENEKAIISGKILTFLSRKSSSETADQKSPQDACLTEQDWWRMNLL